jgi:hypothetical protein
MVRDKSEDKSTTIWVIMTINLEKLLIEARTAGNDVQMNAKKPLYAVRRIQLPVFNFKGPVIPDCIGKLS